MAYVEVDVKKLCCIWYSEINRTWLLETDDNYGPEAIRCTSREDAVRRAKELGMTHESDLDDVKPLP
jgi:hypothetical protein